MSTGVLKTWKDQSGYGFITPDDPNQPDIFLHISTLQKAKIMNVPKPGDRFSFEDGEGRNGKRQALNVVLLT
jgi:cold shock CspA family protein